VGRRPLVRFWAEVAVSTCSAILCAATLIWPRWIELLFHADPDRGNGALEWAFVSAWVTVSVLTAVMARREWRRSACRAT
jgi:hypothetical protein